MTKTAEKHLPFGAAHTCVAHIRENPRGWDLSKCKFVTLCKTLSYANFSPRGKIGNWAIGRLCVVPSNGIHFVFIQSPFLPTLIPISILSAVANLRHSFIVNYANLWGSWCRHRGCIGSLFPSWKTCLPSHDWNLFLFWLLSHSTNRSVITPRRGRISLFSATYSCPTGKPVSVIGGGTKRVSQCWNETHILRACQLLSWV